jgi:hypothetical protein
MGSGYTEGNNGFHHKFEAFDEVYAQATSNWQEGTRCGSGVGWGIHWPFK